MHGALHCELLRKSEVLEIILQTSRQCSKLADNNFILLKRNPRHPSLHLKKVGRFWSVRVGDHYRAIGVQSSDGIVWFWIGTHAEYDRLMQS
jgi:hypothetical protein